MLATATEKCGFWMDNPDPAACTNTIGLLQQRGAGPALLALFVIACLASLVMKKRWPFLLFVGLIVGLMVVSAQTTGGGA